MEVLSTYISSINNILTKGFICFWFLKKERKDIKSYGLYLIIVLGNGIVSLIVCDPIMYEINLSTPIPKPL